MDATRIILLLPRFPNASAGLMQPVRRNRTMAQHAVVPKDIVLETNPIAVKIQITIHIINCTFIVHIEGDTRTKRKRLSELFSQKTYPLVNGYPDKSTVQYRYGGLFIVNKLHIKKSFNNEAKPAINTVLALCISMFIDTLSHALSYDWPEL